jgi:hypothetical protein
MRCPLRAVTNHSAEYLQLWVGATQGDRERIHAAQTLLAAGCGPARVPTCEVVLRWIEYDSWVIAIGSNRRALRAALQGRTLLTRALSLFGPGELHVLQPKCRGLVDHLVALLGLQAAPPSGADVREPGPDGLVAGSEGDRPSVSTVRPDILSGLRSLSLAYWGGRRTSEFDLLESCGASLTELRIEHYGLRAPAAAWSRVVSQCPRLESVSADFFFFPASLLQGLPQLHTLHGVDLAKIPASAIAAALPRLHTLTTYTDSPDPLPIACVDGFCEDLLPRLRVFAFEGVWPSDQSHASGEGAAPRALPLLQELSWAPLRTAPEAFMGGQPLKLEASHQMLAPWIEAAERSSSVATAGSTAFQSPLARLRQLQITGPPQVMGSNGVVDMDRLLRAAPQLRGILTEEWPDDDMYWCKLAAPADPAFGGLVHPWLRSIEVVQLPDMRSCVAPVAPDFAKQLRQGHFPRLRSLRLNGVDYFDNPVDD